MKPKTKRKLSHQVTKRVRAVGCTLPYEVWKQHSKRPVKLTIKILPCIQGEDGVPSVLIEGNRWSLECLGRVILAAAADEDCGYGVSVSGPGSSYFTKQSELGIYIHRLPCINGKFGGRMLRGSNK